MSTYSMSQIVSITGIKSHTLRKWESRYSFLEAERTETNIRYYTDKQLKKLLHIGILTRHGYRISKIDSMSEEDIHNLVSNIILDGVPQDEVSGLVVSTINLDEDAFNVILNTAIINNGIITTVSQIIYPFLAQIGLLWGSDKIMPAQEHFISNLIKQKLFSAIELLPKPHKKAKKALLFLPEGEQHEIGLLLASFIAQKLGWRVFYLGQNVPTENINSVLKIANPDILVTLFISQNSEEKIIAQLQEYLAITKLPISVFGQIHNPESITCLSSQIIFLEKPANFIACLQKEDDKHVIS